MSREAWDSSLLCGHTAMHTHTLHKLSESVHDVMQELATFWEENPVQPRSLDHALYREYILEHSGQLHARTNLKLFDPLMNAKYVIEINNTIIAIHQSNPDHDEHTIYLYYDVQINRT